MSKATPWIPTKTSAISEFAPSLLINTNPPGGIVGEKSCCRPYNLAQAECGRSYSPARVAAGEISRTHSPHSRLKAIRRHGFVGLDGSHGEGSHEPRKNRPAVLYAGDRSDNHADCRLFPAVSHHQQLGGKRPDVHSRYCGAFPAA